MNLPLEIKQHIYCKLLRLTLDDIEDDNFMLIEIEKPNAILLLLGYKEKYISTNNIEWYIRLLLMKPLNINVNLLSYKGNTIFHHINKIIMSTQYLTKDDRELNHLLDKIKLLSQAGVNINMKNRTGDNMAHILISAIFTRFNNMTLYSYIIESLLKIGMDITTIKNNKGFTPYEIGRSIADDNKNDQLLHQMMNSFLHSFYFKDKYLEETKIKFERLTKEVDYFKLKSRK